MTQKAALLPGKTFVFTDAVFTSNCPTLISTSLRPTSQFCLAANESIVLVSNFQHVSGTFASLWLPMEGILWTEMPGFRNFFPQICIAKLMVTYGPIFFPSCQFTKINLLSIYIFLSTFQSVKIYL